MTNPSCLFEIKACDLNNDMEPISAKFHKIWTTGLRASRLSCFLDCGRPDTCSRSTPPRTPQHAPSELAFQISPLSCCLGSIVPVNRTHGPNYINVGWRWAVEPTIGRALIFSRRWDQIMHHCKSRTLFTVHQKACCVRFGHPRPWCWVGLEVVRAEHSPWWTTRWESGGRSQGKGKCASSNGPSCVEIIVEAVPIDAVYRPDCQSMHPGPNWNELGKFLRCLKSINHTSASLGSVHIYRNSACSLHPQCTLIPRFPPFEKVGMRT